VKIKRVLLILGSLFISNGLSAMLPESLPLHDQFVQIFQYSEKYPDKKSMVQALSCELDAACTLLRLVDKGVPLSVIQEAALSGLLDMFVHVLPHDIKIVREMRLQLLSFRLSLQGKIRVKRQTCDFSLFHNPDMPDYQEPVNRSYCGSPDQP
jgi:hypothetical protein